MTDKPPQVSESLLKQFKSAVADLPVSVRWALLLGGWAPMLPWKDVLLAVDLDAKSAILGVLMMGVLGVAAFAHWLLSSPVEFIHVSGALRVLSSQVNQFAFTFIGMAFVSLLVPYAAATLTLSMVLAHVRAPDQWARSGLLLVTGIWSTLTWAVSETSLAIRDLVNILDDKIKGHRGAPGPACLA
jgi:hypothetical protein